MDGFTETHIIGQDTVDATFIEGDHPIEADKLIILKLSAFEEGRLFGESGESFLFMFLLFYHMHDLRIFLFEVTSAFRLFIEIFLHNLMFGQ